MWIQRIADGDLVKCIHSCRHEFIVDVLLDEDAGTCAADLSLIEQDAQLKTVDGHIPLAVAEIDIGAFAA